MLRVVNEPKNEITIGDVNGLSEGYLSNHHILYVINCDQFSNIEKNDIFVLTPEEKEGGTHYRFKAVCKKECTHLDVSYPTIRQAIVKAFEGDIYGDMYFIEKSEILDIVRNRDF